MIKQLTDYDHLVLSFAKVIVANPNYEFDPILKLKFFDNLNQSFDKNWKYEMSIHEAVKYADAFLKVREEIKN